MGGVLDGQVAIVTGGGRGIGAAIAARLARMGASVVVNDVDEEPAIATAKAIADDDGAATPVVGDVRSPADAAAVVAATADAYGGLDILVNNAGLTRDAMIHKMSDEVWDLVVDISLRGSFNLCRAAFPLLRFQPGDPQDHNRKVINLASINGVYGAAGNTNYSAAKAGVIGLTKSLAREWGRQRINVNAVAPGYIAGTRLTAPRGEGDPTGIAPAIVDQIEAQIPIGRPGIPDDIAGVAAFLSSPDSDYVTGQVIEVHGGLEIITVV
ncbi:MAG: SDR family NAD(P)-dependent oxidoreductase [Acidimicrobiales bacterium]